VEAFQSFSVQHVVTVVALALAIAGMCWTGRRLHGTPAGRRYEIGLSAFVWAIWLGYLAYTFIEFRWDPRYALPLQMCDLVAVVAALVFVRPTRELQSLAYFWGLALSTQALITPDLAGGPDSLAFWWFWLYHLFVVGAGVYVVAVQGFRPQWRDLRFALLIGILYAAVIFTIDAVFDVNYGYLGRATPTRPTLLDVLGAWPWRVLVMMLLASLAMALLWLPWAFMRHSSVDRSGFEKRL
jgi:hypothetical integral membrane protein (TIGR02206 family)